MKSKYVVLASALLISISTFAQKDELKTLKKIYDKGEPNLKDITEYKANVEKLATLVATDADKVYFEFYKASIPAREYKEALSKPENKNNTKLGLTYFTTENISKLTTSSLAVIEFEKTSGKEVLTDKITESLTFLKPAFLNLAIELGNQAKYKESSLVIYNVYLLDKSDVEKLYFAASYAVNGQDYDVALNYYNELIKLNYSGGETVYWAKSIASGREETFSSKDDRDKYLKIKTHVEPRDEVIPSKRGEIYKNVALIYVQKGKVDEAKKAIVNARTLNPEDTSLILTEANLYLETKDFATYKKLISEVLQKNPNNAELLYNLGVISYNNKEYADSEKYYIQAISIDSKYTNAYLNLAILKLDPEKALIDKMNKLGTSAAENKQYDIYKKQREDIFKSAIPYLEKAYELDPKNDEVGRTLLNVYKALEITDKAKALKAQLDNK